MKTGPKPTYVSFVCKECGKQFSMTKSKLSTYKNRTPKTCSNECRKKFVAKQKRANRKGSEFKCRVCGKTFYRGPSNVNSSNPICCSRGCLAKCYSGKNNPFWNKRHTEETKKKISQSRKGKGKGNKNALGYKHLEEAKKRISKTSKTLWKNQREMMLDSRLRGKDSPLHKLPHERRHRKNFTNYQRKNWSGIQCAYCGSKKHLELDHIVPIFNGGTNIRENCQTLCRGCNLWKTHKVDIPVYYAALAIQGDPN